MRDWTEPPGKEPWQHLADLDLAHGRIVRARWNPGGRTLELVLRTPGEPHGRELLLRYGNVERLEPSLARVARLVEDPATVVLGSALQEVPGGWRHTLRTGGGALEVDHATLQLSETLVAGAADPLAGGPRFEVLSC